MQDVNAQLRSIKLALEARIKTKIESNWAILEWALPHAAFAISKYSVGHDGKTPHQRLLGKRFEKPIIEFGEVVLAKIPMTSGRIPVRTGARQKKLLPRWMEAVWLGVNHRTQEHIVSTDIGKIIRVRSVKRVPEERRWSAKKIEDVKGTPRRPDPNSNERTSIPEYSHDKVEIDIKETGCDIQRPITQDPVIDVREMRITKVILAKYGCTPGCEGCVHAESHSLKCRSRIEDAMEQDEHDKHKIQESRERVRKKMAERDEIRGSIEEQ